jgi:hypothetical protein
MAAVAIAPEVAFTTVSGNVFAGCEVGVVGGGEGKGVAIGVNAGP